MLKTKHRHFMAFSLFVTSYKTVCFVPDHWMEAALCRTTYEMWGAQLMPLICMQMCAFLKKGTSARDKFRALAFMNLLKSFMYVKHIRYNMVSLSMFWWCLKATVSLLKASLELKFEDKDICAVWRFTAENLFLTEALQIFYISRYFLCSLIVSTSKNIL